MEVERVDLSLICRTCKCVSSSMKSVFEGIENASISPHNPRIDEMLMAFAAVQVQFGDGLPTLMCAECIQNLKKAIQFKKQCESVDSSLREYCKNMKVDAIKQELQNSDFIESLNTLSNLLNGGEPAPPKETTATASASEPTTSAPVPAEPKPEEGIKSETDYIQFLDNNQMLLTCRECAKMFTTIEGLRCHKRVHAGTTFKCKQCDKEYTRKNHLERHEASHGKRKVHVCKICNKTLTRMEHLKRHLITHLREKPFNCKTCNRGFNRVEHLHNHTPRCKGENVHICPVCNKAFNREDSLEVHKQQHDKSSLSLPTIENLDNIDEHYYEVDYDAVITFSDTSDMEDCFEPQVEVTETVDETKVETESDCIPSAADDSSSQDSYKERKKKTDPDVECIEPTDLDQEAEDIDENCTLAQLASAIVKSEDNKIELHLQEEEDDVEDEDDADVSMENDIADLRFIGNDNDMGNDNDSSSESSDEEYTPTKKPVPAMNTGKRRGRPRIHPPKVKTGRRGRPPGSKGKKKPPKVEEEEETGEFPCPVCGEFYEKLSLLDKHAREAHPGLKVYKCNICQKDFNRPNHLKRHMTSHSEDKPHACDVCTKSFSRKDHLIQHQKLHEKQEDMACDICEKPFNRADQLAKHKAAKHGIGEKLTIMGEKKYICEICQKGFTTEKYRDVHMKAHNGEKTFQCRVCEKSFLSKSHLTEHMKFHNEHCKKFLCSECGQRFIRNDYLVIHMRRHRGEKPFKCKFCGKGFPRTTDLTVHERYHTGEKTHLCTVCGRGFGRAYNLTVHMRTHTGEKPYQCTYCDAAFAQGNDLKAHIRRHTGERFQCDLCSESFLMGYLLTQHKRTVHGLNVVSNIRRLQPVHKTENPDDPPPITIPLPKPVVPENLMFSNLLPSVHKQEKPDSMFSNFLQPINNQDLLQPLSKKDYLQPLTKQDLLQPIHKDMLQPIIHKQEKLDDPPPPITIPLSKPMMPENFMFNHLQAQLSLSQMHFTNQRPAT